MAAPPSAKKRRKAAAAAPPPPPKRAPKGPDAAELERRDRKWSRMPYRMRRIGDGAAVEGSGGGGDGGAGRRLRLSEQFADAEAAGAEAAARCKAAARYLQMPLSHLSAGLAASDSQPYDDDAEAADAAVLRADAMVVEYSEEGGYYGADDDAEEGAAAAAAGDLGDDGAAVPPPPQQQRQPAAGEAAAPQPEQSEPPASNEVVDGFAEGIMFKLDEKLQARSTATDNSAQGGPEHSVLQICCGASEHKDRRRLVERCESALQTAKWRASVGDIAAALFAHNPRWFQDNAERAMGWLEANADIWRKQETEEEARRPAHHR